MDLFSLNARFQYVGSPLPNKEKDLTPEELEENKKQKEIRRILGLPITKQLVYYQHPYSKASIRYVTSFNAKKFVNDKGQEFDWYVAELEVVGIEESIIIHGDFFSEMQKTDFVNDVQ